MDLGGSGGREVGERQGRRGEEDLPSERNERGWNLRRLGGVLDLRD